ncbi:hypothetical protein GCM10010515_68260 [Streptomyces fructofermentans]|uniref:Uncharacterized protein n=1 Tax=Streptomyces fructofermentans TaxID=152141 RepID=A0A918NSB8_9ACTN|nr:hypothetical protein GCM10010515_68260 [Streptomyces fructofermentans]
MRFLPVRVLIGFASPGSPLGAYRVRAESYGVARARPGTFCFRFEARARIETLPHALKLKQ